MLDLTSDGRPNCQGDRPRDHKNTDPARVGQAAPADLPKVALSPKKPRPGELKGLDPDKRLKRPASNRSGGPRTAKGIATASNNSLKHGVYGVQRPQTHAYQDKLRAVFEELNPHGVISRTLCEDIAHGLAKIETLNAYERQQISKGEQDGVSLIELARRLDFPWADTHLDALGGPANIHDLQRRVLRSWKRLALPPQDFLGSLDAPGTEVLTVPDLRVANLYERGCVLLAQPGLCEFEHEAFLLELDVVMLDARQGSSYLGRRIAKSGDTSVLVSYWLYRNSSRLQECVRAMQNERMIAVLTDERLVRANAQVQRGLKESLSCIKTVRELRSVAYE